MVTNRHSDGIGTRLIPKTSGLANFLCSASSPTCRCPSCWKVREFRAVQIVDASGDFHQQASVLTLYLRGYGRIRVDPGASTTLRPPGGTSFAEGDHCIYLSPTPTGSCMAIWVSPAAP